MKKILVSLCVTLCAVVCWAGSDMITFPAVTSVKGIGLAYSTNDNTVPVMNFVEGVKVDVTNTTLYKSSGATTPAAGNGYWTAGGTYSGQTYYVNQAGTWFVWYDGQASNWITTNLGFKTYGWTAQTNGTDYSVISNYQALATTGTLALITTSNNVSVGLYSVPNTGMGTPRTLYLNTNIYQNAYVPLRQICQDNTATNLPGIYGKQPLGNERMRLIIGNAWHSNVTAQVRVVITDHP